MCVYVYVCKYTYVEKDEYRVEGLFSYAYMHSGFTCAPSIGVKDWLWNMRAFDQLSLHHAAVVLSFFSHLTPSNLASAK